MTSGDRNLFTEITKLNLFNIEEIKSFIINYTKLSCNLVVDKSGNIIKEDANTRNLIIFDFRPVGFTVNNIIDDRAYLDLIGCQDTKQLNGKETSVGIIKKVEDKFYVSNLNFNFLHQNISTPEHNICEGNSLYGIQLNAYIPLFMLVKLISEQNDCVRYYNFTLYNRSISSICGCTELIRRIMPEKVILVSLCYENDITKSGAGPAIVIKDGNGVTKKEVYSQIENIATTNNIQHQFFIGKTDKIYENMLFDKIKKKAKRKGTLL